jgi:hypothetical protein
MKCEYCKKETNGIYLGGRFCDKHCARNFKRFPKIVPPAEIPKLGEESQLLESFSKKKKVKKI